MIELWSNTCAELAKLSCLIFHLILWNPEFGSVESISICWNTMNLSVLARSYLTKEEIEIYCKTVLHLNVSTQDVSSSSLELLRQIYTNYNRLVPYSSLRYISVPVEQRGLPSIEYIRHMGLNKLGGMCYETNVFLSWILIGLGFDVSYLLVNAIGAAYVNHIMLSVRHEGCDYIVDAGLGISLAPNLIPLDFEETSPEYTSSFWTMKFHKVGERIIGASRITEFTSYPNRIPTLFEEGWANVLDWENRKLSLEDLAEKMNEVYKSPTKAPAMVGLYCLRFPNGKAQMLRRRDFYREENGVRKERNCKTDEELLKLILEEFGDVIDHKTAVEVVALQSRIEKEREALALPSPTMLDASS